MTRASELPRSRMNGGHAEVAVRIRKRRRKPPKKGTWELRYEIRGFGPLRVASGTKSGTVLKKMRELIKKLISAQKFDYLRLLRDRAITPGALLERIGGLDAANLPRVKNVEPLDKSVPAWQADRVVSDDQRKNDRWAWKRLLARAKPDDTAEEVGGLLRRERQACKKLDQRAAFNRIRAAALAFLRDTVGQRSMAYLDAWDVKVLPTRRKREGNPQTVMEAFALAQALGDFAAAWMSMCLTGMGPDEYWGEWTPRDGHLWIQGTKRGGRARFVPLIWVAPAIATPRLFAQAIKAASQGRVQPYDARRTFAMWQEEIGIIASRRDAYMGHGPRSMTDLYARSDVRKYLDADRDALIAWIMGQMPEKLPDLVRGMLPSAA